MKEIVKGRLRQFNGSGVAMTLLLRQKKNSDFMLKESKSNNYRKIVE